MDAKEARQLSNLNAREFPEATYDFLKCQLGNYKNTLVQTSPYRSVTERVFHLVAYGSTWDAAIDMWKRL